MNNFHRADQKRHFGGGIRETNSGFKPGIKVFAAMLIGLAAVWFGVAISTQTVKSVRGAANIPPHLAIQLAYEEKLSAMQNALDVLNNKLASRAQDYSSRLVKLQAQQARLAQRHFQLESLFQQTQGKSELTLGRLPSSTLMARADKKPDRASPQDVMEQMARLQARQSKLIASVTEASQNRVTTLSRVLQKLTTRISKNKKAMPQLQTIDTGGPFLPLGPLSKLYQSLGVIENNTRKIKYLTNSITDMPVARPVSQPIKITSGYGARKDPFRKTRATHSGVDIRGKRGTPVLATANGRVIKAGRYAAYGRMVELEHKNGITTRYAHLSRIGVNVGDRVRAHELIGRIGSTGRSTGPHLHYETRIYGKTIDPLRFLQAGKHVYEGKTQTSVLPRNQTGD